MPDVAIADFLASLGLSGADAERARAELESAGLTNPRKSRLSRAKLEPARSVLDARFARFCASCAARTDAGGREVVIVPPAACTRCGGSRNARALTEMVEACEAAGVRRIVVVGGSPDVRRELGAVAGGPELRLVDGTERRTKADAQRDLAWGDLIVIAGASELGHKVSNLYKVSGPTPVVTSGRRGVEAIADVVDRARAHAAEPAEEAIWRGSAPGRSLDACSVSADRAGNSSAVTATRATSSRASRRSPKLVTCAALFPSVRLGSASVLAFADRVAAELGEDDEVAEDVLDEGLALVGDGELRELVRRWRLDYPAQWQSLVHTSADERAVLREVGRGALDAAIMERAATPDELLATVEDSGLSPGPALALVVPPHWVWSYNEARVAVAAGPKTPIDEVAAALHAVRPRAAGVGARGAPRAGAAARRLSAAASALLADACLDVARHRVRPRRPHAPAPRLSAHAARDLQHFAQLT